MREETVGKDVVCPGCAFLGAGYVGAIAPNNLFAGRILDRALDGGGLYQCPKCDLMFRFPRISEVELNELYRLGNDDNWSVSHGERQDWRIAKEWLEKQAGIRTVLDVGCFDGGFLEYLGAQYARSGIEIHPGARMRARARGIDIVADDFSELPSLDVRVDAVTAIDVIEHSHSPEEFLAALASVVNMGGVVILATGNTNARSWRLMGSRYWYCHIAEHLSFVSPQWAERIAPGLGMEVIYTRQFSHSQGSASLARRAREAVANLVLRFAPGVFRRMRRRGFGGIDLVRYPEMELSPPTWMTAKDHVLLVFRKTIAT